MERLMESKFYVLEALCGLGLNSLKNSLSLCLGTSISASPSALYPSLSCTHSSQPQPEKQCSSNLTVKADHREICELRILNHWNGRPQVALLQACEDHAGRSSDPGSEPPWD